MPFLDTLLDNAMVLDDHRSCSNWTLSSLVCLLTAQSTVDLGIEPLSGDPEVADVSDQMSMAPMWLQEAGFRAAAVSASPFLWDEYPPTAGGFETITFRDEGFHDYSTADWVAQTALPRLADIRSSGDPWYLHLHFMDPHSPFDEHPEEWALEGLEELPELEDWDLTTHEGVDSMMNAWKVLPPESRELVGQHLDAYYRADLRFLDKNLALLWEGLEAEGALDDTLVVFWADHGEQFFDHGDYGHNQSLFGEENQTLAAFWAQDIVPGSWEGPTEHRDIFPTVFGALGGLALPEGVTGRALGDRPVDEPRLSIRYSAPDPVKMAVDLSGMRMYYDWSGEKGLYDLASDPQEQVNLYDPDSDVVQALWEPLNDEIDRVLVYIPDQTPLDRGP